MSLPQYMQQYSYTPDTSRVATPVPQLEPLRHPFVACKLPGMVSVHYKFRCQSSGSARDGYHDAYEFVWDNYRDYADPARAERARAYDLLNSNQIKCRCSDTIVCRGSDIVDESVSNEKSAEWRDRREEKLDERIKALEAALAKAEMHISQTPRLVIGNAKDELPPPSQVSCGTIFVTLKGEMFISVPGVKCNEWMLMAGANSMSHLTDAEIDELRIRLGLKKPEINSDAVAVAAAAVAAMTAKTQTPSSEKTEPSMTDPVTPQPTLTRRVINTVKSDSADAAWRVAGNQFVRLTRDPLIAKLSENMAPGDPATRLKIAAFLSTDIGEAVLAVVLAVGLEMAPKKLGPVPGRLAQELRVRSFALGFDTLAEMVAKPVRDLISSGLLDDAIASLPQELPDGERLPTDVARTGEAIGVKTKEGEQK